MVRALTSYSDASSRALRRRGAQARSSSTSAYSRSVRFTFRPYDLVPTNSAGRAGTDVRRVVGEWRITWAGLDGLSACRCQMPGQAAPVSWLLPDLFPAAAGLLVVRGNSRAAVAPAASSSPSRAAIWRNRTLSTNLRQP